MIPPFSKSFMAFRRFRFQDETSAADAGSNVPRPQEAEMSRRRVRCIVLIALTLLCGGCQTMARIPLLSRSAGLPEQYEADTDESR